MAIELLFLLLLAYLLLGPQKSARLAHKAGGLLAQMNKVKADVKARLNEELSSVKTNSGIDDLKSRVLPAVSLQAIGARDCVDLLASISSTTHSQTTAVPLTHSPIDKEATNETRIPDQIDRNECLPS